MRQNLIQNTEAKHNEVKEKIEQAKLEIEAETQKRLVDEESKDEASREQLITEYAAIKKENREVNEKLKMFEKCDPAKFEELKQKTKVCKDSTTRWTDNLFELESWMKKTNPGLT